MLTKKIQFSFKILFRIVTNSSQTLVDPSVYLCAVTLSALEESCEHDAVPLVSAVIGGSNLVIFAVHDPADVLTQSIVAEKLRLQLCALLLKFTIQCFSSGDALVLLTHEHWLLPWLWTTLVLDTPLQEALIGQVAVLGGVLTPGVLHQVLVCHWTHSVLKPQEI